MSTEQIKQTIIDFVFAEERPKITLSKHLTEKFGYHYAYLAKVFTNKEGISIREFIIKQKIDSAKQMLKSGTSCKEIMYKLNYSNPGHLSNHFKQKTGITLSEYKSING